MNFQTMKWMIENLIKNHKCPVCQSSVKENNIDIIGAAGSTLNIDIECPQCKKHTMVKAEIAHINLGTFQNGKESLEWLKSYIENFKKNLGTSPHIEMRIEADENELINGWKKIEDSQIIDLSKALKSKKINAADLFWE